MTRHNAETERRRAFAAAGLAPEALDPWKAWKAFKTLLHGELEGGYDAASFQVTKHPAVEDGVYGRFSG